MNNGFRVVHYVNQLFGGIGSEEKASLGPQVKVGPVGPGRAIQNELRERGYIVATAICGDNYFVERIDKAAEELLRLISPCKPDILIAGPAFNAGRYGVACGEVCKLVQDKLSIPAVTGMYEENPGVDLYRKDVYIIGTSDSAMGMTAAIPLMVNMAYKLVAKEDIGNPKKEGYFARGFSVNEKLSKNAAERAVDAVIAKIKNQPVESEISVQHFEHTNPAPPIKDLSSARICLVTDGGLIPKGNPDKLMPRSAERFGSYNIRGISALSPEAYEAYHVGHDTSFINQDPHRLVPLDVMRELEEEGVIGETHEIFVTTAGVAASLSNSQKVGKDIATQLINEGVDAAILTSTWGSSTRCGAAITRELESVGIPTAHICTMTPVALMIGSHRIIRGGGILNPVGNPELDPKTEKKFRRTIIEKALEALRKEIEKGTIFETTS